MIIILITIIITGNGDQKEKFPRSVLEIEPDLVSGLSLQTGEVQRGPTHEVIFRPLVSVPDRHLQLLALVLVEEHLEVLPPPGAEALVHDLGLVPLSRQPGEKAVKVRYC